MASPIGHGLAGILIYRRRDSRRPAATTPELRHRWAAMAGYVLLANLPDFDFFVGWLTTGHPNAYHHGASHSLFFAAAAAALVALTWKEPGGFWSGWKVYFIVIGSHALIDLFTGAELGLHTSGGVPLLAPLTSLSFTSPVTLFIGPDHAEFRDLFAAHNWIGSAFDLIPFGLVAGALFLFGSPGIPEFLDRRQPVPASLVARRREANSSTRGIGEEDRQRASGQAGIEILGSPSWGGRCAGGAAGGGS